MKDFKLTGATITVTTNCLQCYTTHVLLTPLVLTHSVSEIIWFSIIGGHD